MKCGDIKKVRLKHKDVALKLRSWSFCVIKHSTQNWMNE
jgi:hypothetical protein